MDYVSPPTHDIGPLSGLRVLELGQLIAGPFAAKTLADFGADVVKVERDRERRSAKRSDR